MVLSQRLALMSEDNDLESVDSLEEQEQIIEEYYSDYDDGGGGTDDECSELASEEEN